MFIFSFHCDGKCTEISQLLSSSIVSIDYYYSVHCVRALIQRRNIFLTQRCQVFFWWLFFWITNYQSFDIIWPEKKREGELRYQKKRGNSSFSSKLRTSSVSHNTQHIYTYKSHKSIPIHSISDLRCRLSSRHTNHTLLIHKIILLSFHFHLL